MLSLALGLVSVTSGAQPNTPGDGPMGPIEVVQSWLGNFWAAVTSLGSEAVTTEVAPAGPSTDNAPIEEDGDEGGEDGGLPEAGPEIEPIG